MLVTLAEILQFPVALCKVWCLCFAQLRTICSLLDPFHIQSNSFTAPFTTTRRQEHCVRCCA